MSDTERWRSVDRIFAEALEHPAADRVRFVAVACAGDSDLQREIESLLAQAERRGVLDEPVAGDDVHPTLPALPAGTMIGPYRLEASIGLGGMGRVYRALDTRLDRSVALKFVQRRFMSRFDREARAIAALNHPAICTLHDVGPDYLVLELLDGEPLSTLLSRGKLPIERVLEYGRQIADALAEAHAHGVIHRDLKPANLFVTRTGIKVLDFGVAKFVDREPQAALTTAAGIGTLSYMAPEQMREGPVTPAADLFALGLILFEMAEGRLPVPGVPLGSALAAGTPLRVPALSDRSTRGCRLSALVAELLQLEPRCRPSDASTVRDRLAAIASKPGAVHVNRLVALAALSVVALAVGTIWWVQSRRSARVLVPARVSQLMSVPGMKSDPAFSPDGTSVAFSWNGGGVIAGSSIYTVQIGASTPNRITAASATDVSPMWSPNSRELVFVRLNNVSHGSVIVVPSSGGTERTLLDVTLTEDIYRTMRPLVTWTPDGTSVVFTSQDPDSGRATLYAVNAAGGPARRLFDATSEVSKGHAAPAFSLDGRWLAYVDVTGPTISRVFVRGVAAGLRFPDAPVAVSESGHVNSPNWSPDGRLLFVREADVLEWRPGALPTNLYAGATQIATISAAWAGDALPRLIVAQQPRREFRMVPLGAGGLAPAGPPTTFADNSSDERTGQFSPDGKQFVFVSTRNGTTEAWIADASGTVRPLTHLNAVGLGWPRWSPDGTRVAMHVFRDGKPQIFSVDAGTGALLTQVTTSPLGFYMDCWAQTGDTLLLTRASGDPTRTFRVRADGSHLEDLFEGGPGAVAADGRSFIYGKAGRAGLFRRSMEGDTQNNPEERLADDYISPGADLNPFEDGVYYISGKSDGQPKRVRYYVFSQHKSVDVLTIDSLTPAPAGLAVSPDRSRLVYDVVGGRDLTLVEFR
jgi:serine/threonine protein kinase